MKPVGRGGGGGGGSMSARYGQWHREKGSTQARSGPRLIFFVLGGISYSEMRCAYEVMNSMTPSVATSNTSASASALGGPNSGSAIPSSMRHWDILVGGTHLLTPEIFISDLERLSNPPGSAVAEGSGGAAGGGGGVSGGGPGGPAVTSGGGPENV